MESIGSPALWGAFTVGVLVLLALDLGVFHRKAHVVGYREAAIWSAVWIALALAFCAGVRSWFGPERAMEFLTGYLIEKSLSIDNIFIIMIIFSTFGVPAMYQHRVLFWGILGALVMRAGFILGGAALLSAFHWLIYVFGGLLLVTGIKLLVRKDETVDPRRNPFVGLFRRFFATTDEFAKERFFIRSGAQRKATPLFVALLAVEATDVMMAIDSIPAVFAITRDPFIVYTSNIFAILGLRALFFLLAGMLAKFVYLKVGLALVLGFVGAKMLVIDFVKIPTALSLGIVCALLGGSVAISLLRRPRTLPVTPAN